MHSTRTCVIAIVLGAGLAACNPISDANLTNAAQCVDIPDGQFFEFIDGKLVAVSSLDEQGGEQPILTAQRIGRSLADTGAWPNWVEGDEFRAIRDKDCAASPSGC